MGDRRKVLRDLLRVALENWSYGEVRDAIDEIVNEAHREMRDRQPAHRKSAKKQKPSAIEQVEQIDVGESKKLVLRELAVRFDNKQFLPTPSDVREFLLTLDVRTARAENRSEAFRHVLKALAQLSDERLAKVANSRRHSGPSRLGPISDAISEVAESMPRRREGSEE